MQNIKAKKEEISPTDENVRLIDEELVDKLGIVERSRDTFARLGVDIGYHFPHAVIRLLLC